MHLLSQIPKDERRTTFPVSRSAHSGSASPDIIQGAAADRAGTSSFTAAQRRHNAATLSAQDSACCPLKKPGLGCVFVCSLHPKQPNAHGGLSRQAGRVYLSSAIPSQHRRTAECVCERVCVWVCVCVRTRNYRGVIRRDSPPPDSPPGSFTTQLMTSDLLDLTWMRSVCAPAGALHHRLITDAMFKGALRSFLGKTFESEEKDLNGHNFHPVWLCFIGGGPCTGWGWFLVRGEHETQEKKEKYLIQTRNKWDLKLCLQIQHFELGSKLLRHFISTFPFSTVSWACLLFTHGNNTHVCYMSVITSFIS